MNSGAPDSDLSKSDLIQDTNKLNNLDPKIEKGYNSPYWAGNSWPLNFLRDSSVLSWCRYGPDFTKKSLILMKIMKLIIKIEKA